MKIPSRSQGERQIRARRSPVAKRLVLPAQRFLHNEALSGALLVIAAAAALIWANSAWSEAYFDLLASRVSIWAGPFRVSRDFHHWINEGLMVFFFFVAALEIKREMVHGELSKWRTASLPVAAALGGMVAPVGIFLAINRGGSGASGWGIPMATDIAFAVGVLALLGRRAPQSLRILLLSYAVVDDIGSILVIAVYYTSHFSMPAIGMAAGALALIAAARAFGIRKTSVYWLLGFLFWLGMLESGVHATISGVILGFLTPSRPAIRPREFWKSMDERISKIRESKDEEDFEPKQEMLGEVEELVIQTEAPLERLERMVHPWVAFVVLPIFALANAGVAFTGGTMKDALTHPVALGVAFGLLAGKPIGVVGASWLAVRFSGAQLPQGVTWAQVFGIGILGGVGFTVSLFISDLAFDEESLTNSAKLGIILASVLAALIGAGWLFFAVRRKEGGDETEDESQAKD